MYNDNNNYTKFSYKTMLKNYNYIILLTDSNILAVLLKNILWEFFLN